MPIAVNSAPLAIVLDAMTVEGAPELTEQLDDGALKCYACGHRCLIKLDKRGICKVRFNEGRSEEHTSELQSQSNLVCRLLLEKKKKKKNKKNKKKKIKKKNKKKNKNKNI